ncbi:hypothetical protein SVAN01_11334 [Stagonosporopsis vannaccii]|nr:hypothetical protein SVAN01_11334 [Stagonosporopsis vannaccii]
MRTLSIVVALALQASASEVKDCIAKCTPSTFRFPSVPGLEVLSITAAPLYNFSFVDYFTGPYTAPPLCNVNVTYTHPGYNDTSTVFTWLPLEDWNGRYLSLGGGGYSALNLITDAAPGFRDKFATAGTDAGHVLDMFNPNSWILSSPNNVNYNLLQLFADRSVSDLPKIAKSIVADYYGRPPAYSYFSGCSNGGRQGLVSAQRYPGDYDGIMSNAPALYWSSINTGALYPQIVMKNEDYYPSNCELNAFTEASIKACDEIDGVADGVVGNPDLCQYKAQELVGATVECPDNTTVTITEQAAKVVQAIWAGPVDTNGTSLFYPLDIGSDLTLTANTSLVDGRRVSNPQALPRVWIPNFIKKNQSFDISTIDHQEFANIFRRGIKEYESIINNHDPDLREFRASGAKLLGWVGTLDQISPKKPLNVYYDEIRALLPDVEDFYRMFNAPGCSHCGANLDGSGYLPQNPLRYLTAWVENGTLPDTILGRDETTGMEQPLCIWPKVARWDGVNNASVATSYSCEDSY